MAAYPILDWSIKSYTAPQIESQTYIVCSPLSNLNHAVLIVVCDGKASMVCGAQAARLTAYHVMQSYSEHSLSFHPQQALANAVREAWQATREREYGECINMRADICAAVIVHDLAFVAQIGEIRAYFLRAGRFTTLSHRYETESFDFSSLIQLRLVLDTGDRILLCNNGLYSALNEEQILGIIRQRWQSEQIVTELIDAAVMQDPQNSISAALLCFNSRQISVESLTAPEEGKSVLHIWGVWATLILLLSLAGVMGLFIFSPNFFQTLVNASPKPEFASTRMSSSLKPRSRITVSLAATTISTALTTSAKSKYTPMLETTYPTPLPSSTFTDVVTLSPTATPIPTASPEPKPAATPSPTSLNRSFTVTETSMPTPEMARHVFVLAPLGTNVNIRRGASVRTRTIGILRPGQIAELVGQTANHEWWQIRVGARVGWIFAGSVTIYGDPSFVPINQ